MNFGELIRRYREQRGLSLRELGKLAVVDHAYIHRLESGDKTSPSDDTLRALVRGLKLGGKSRQILEYVLDREAPTALVDAVLENDNYDFDDFSAAAAMSFRGAQPKTPEEWCEKLNLIKELRAG